MQCSAGTAILLASNTQHSKHTWQPTWQASVLECMGGESDHPTVLNTSKYPWLRTRPHNETLY
jgi:hypothetical protein